MTTQANIFHMEIPVNGISLHAVVAGPENGPLVVLLHGFPEFWYGWNRQVDFLASAGYRVVVPDQRGYNLSEKPSGVKEYTLDKLTGDIIGLIDYFGRETAVVAGHDWGAVVAWHLGLHYPERISKLIIVNVPHPSAMRRALQKPVWKQLRKSWYILYFQLPLLPEWGCRLGNFRQLIQSITKTSLPGTFLPGELQRYIEAWSQPGALTTTINWYRALLRFGDNINSLDRKTVNDQIRVPTLVLWGNQDAFLEPFLADWSRDCAENCQVIHFDDATHWILHEKPEQVNEAILRFIDNP